jgi:hypothetical protein
MLKRFLGVVAIGTFLELGAFTYVNRDALALTTNWPIWDTGRAAFEQRADRLLRRPKVTRTQVETIAGQAHALALPAIEARAFGVFSERDPHDRAIKLRQADALRRAGDLHRAERVYLGLLTDTTLETR